MTIFIKTFYDGYKFSQIWPKNEPYLMMFDQTKAIRLADTALTVAPAIALLTMWLQLHYLGLEAIHTAVAMSLLILSMPAHGYFQLGQQSQRRLPIALQRWYRELESKIQEQEATHPTNKVMNSRLTFMDLATLLNQLFGEKQK